MSNFKCVRCGDTGRIAYCACGENGSFSCTCDMQVVGEDACPECHGHSAFRDERKLSTTPVLEEKRAESRPVWQ